MKPIKLNKGQNLEFSTEVKYLGLGVTVDQHLKWNEHIKNANRLQNSYT